MSTKRRTILTAAAFAIMVTLITIIPVWLWSTHSTRWIIEGCAATPDIDMNGVLFEEPALRRAAGRMLDYPTILLNHDQSRPIGRILSAKFVVSVLWIKAEISRTEPDVWAKIKDGTLSGLSIGVVPFAQEEDYSAKLDRPFVRVARFEIVEVSVVAIPSNPRARIVEHAEERGR